METLYRWRVLEKDRLGRPRWRIVKSPMTESTARFWAANNNKVIERVDAPAAPSVGARSVSGTRSGTELKTTS